MPIKPKVSDRKNIIKLHQTCFPFQSLIEVVANFNSLLFNSFIRKTFNDKGYLSSHLKIHR